MMRFLLTFMMIFFACQGNSQTVEEIKTLQMEIADQTKTTAKATKQKGGYRFEDAALGIGKFFAYAGRGNPKATITSLNAEEQNILNSQQDIQISTPLDNAEKVFNWVAVLANANKSDDDKKIILMKFMPAIRQYYEGEAPFDYYYPSEPTYGEIKGNWLISMRANSYDALHNFQRWLVKSVIHTRFKGTTFPSTFELAQEARSLTSKVYTLFSSAFMSPLVSLSTPPPLSMSHQEVKMWLDEIMSTITFTDALPFEGVSDDDVSFLKGKLPENALQAVKVIIENSDIKKDLTTPYSDLSTAPYRFYLLAYYYISQTALSDGERAQLNKIAHAFTQIIFAGTPQKLAAGNTPSSMILHPDITGDQKEAYDNYVIELTKLALQSVYFKELSEGTDLTDRKEEVSQLAGSLLQSILGLLIPQSQLQGFDQTEPFASFIANASDVIQGKSASSGINVEVIATVLRKVFAHMADSFYTGNEIKVQLTADEKAFINSNAHLYNDKLKALQQQFLAEATPPITALSNTDLIRFEGSAFFLIPALALIRKQGNVDEAMVQSIEKKIAQKLFRGHEAAFSSGSTITGFQYDTAALGNLGQLNPADIMNLGEPQAMTPEVHIAFLMMYTVSALAAQYLDPDQGNFDLGQADFRESAVRIFGVLFGWSVPELIRSQLMAGLTLDTVVNLLGEGFEKLYAALFGEARAMATNLLVDKQDKINRDAQFNAAMEAMKVKLPDEPIIPESGHGSMVTHHGMGIFTVDPGFMESRQTLLSMNDYSYALAKSLNFQLSGEASKQALQEAKRDKMRAGFEREGWEFKEIRGTSGVANPQDDIMGFVAYHAVKKLLYVIYHGSSSSADWEVNFDFEKISAAEKGLPLPGQYHRGFLNKYMSGRQMLIAAFSHFANQMSEDDRQKVKMVISGHSQGGGLATIALADIGLNLSKGLFGQDYVNADKHQIYAWLLASARAADEEGAAAFTQNFGVYNIVRQQTSHDPVPLTGPDSLGQDLIRKIPVIGEQYVRYSGYRSVGVLALAEDYYDNVQLQLDKAIAVNTERSVNDVRKQLGNASPDAVLDSLLNLGGALGRSGMRAGATLLAPIHLADTVEDESGVFSVSVIDMDLIRMLFDGWWDEKEYYANRGLPFPFENPFGTGRLDLGGVDLPTPEIDNKGNMEPHITSGYITSDELAHEFLSRHYIAVARTPAGSTPKEDKDLRRLLLEEMEGLSYDQLNDPKISGLQKGLAPLTQHLAEDNPDMRYAWLMTSAIEDNPAAGAKRCANKFEQDPKLKAILDRPRDIYQIAMVVFESKMLDPRNGNLIEGRQKQYCGAVFGTKR